MYHEGGSGNLLYGVYSDASDSPENLLAFTPATTVSPSAGWQEVSLTSPLAVNAGQKVWLAWVYENGGVIYYTSGTPGRAHTDDYYTGNLPSVFGPSSVTDFIYSIYATLIPGVKAYQDDPPETNLQDRDNTFSFTLFPNPAQENLLYISILPMLAEEQKVRIEIIDLAGKVLQSWNRTGTTLSQPFILNKNTSNLNFVIVRLTTDTQVSISKLIIK